jgi:hypothetical protein
MSTAMNSFAMRQHLNRAARRNEVRIAAAAASATAIVIGLRRLYRRVR